MEPCPAELDSFRVVLSTPIDWRHTPTDACHHSVGGEDLGPVEALAICTDGDSFYLFYCDNAWAVITDTWHSSLEDAKTQAEFEYLGVSATWQRAG